MTDQLNWAVLLQPDFCQLKFKIPCLCDQHATRSPLGFQYPPGDLYSIPWSPNPSTELRLICSRAQLQQTMTYNQTHLLGRIDYHNLWVRCLDASDVTWGQILVCNSIDKLASEWTIPLHTRLFEFWPQSQLQHYGWDCIAELVIWCAYNQQHGDGNLINIMTIISQIRCLTLCLNPDHTDGDRNVFRFRLKRTKCQ
jgi:hypothetical protein